MNLHSELLLKFILIFTFDEFDELGKKLALISIEATQFLKISLRKKAEKIRILRSNPITQAFSDSLDK